MEIPTEVEETIVTSQVRSASGPATRPCRSGEKVESIRTELSIPGGIQITYDSKDPDAKIDNEQLKFLEDVFKLAGQIDYTVILDAKNKVKAVEGTEKLLEKAEKLDPQMVRDSMRGRALGRQAQEEVRAVARRTCRTSWPGPASPGSGPRPSTPAARSSSFRKKYEYAGTEKKGDKTLDKITAKVIEVKIDAGPQRRVAAAR